MEAVRSSETSINYWILLRHIPEDITLGKKEHTDIAGKVDRLDFNWFRL
jgi:hypothetical protein